MSVRIICADVMDGLAHLADESVNCCVTSPPYWGLRDYGVDGQIGLEPTPEAFLVKMIEAFREVRRVLRSDGTLWLNIGDGYASAGGAGWQGKNGQRASRAFTAPNYKGNSAAAAAVKPKDLIGMPWMVAFALRADGWWLRQEIIWSKPNPMPESVQDRCTKSHEHLFLLSKSDRYWWNAEAIQEPVSGGAHARRSMKKPDGWNTASGAHGNFHPAGREKGKAAGVTPKSAKPRSGIKANESFHAAVCDLVETRNKRSVWTIATQPYSDAHFATFPEELPETCIKAGCPVGGTVLDPFGGAGTTGLVADKLGRHAILIELNPEYAAMAERRIRGDCPMFTEVRP